MLPASTRLLAARPLLPAQTALQLAITPEQRAGIEQDVPGNGREKVGEALYNRGVYNAMLVVEGIRNAQKLTGKKVINSEDMRRGLESLNLTEARLKEIGLGGFVTPTTISCTDHSGHSKMFVSEWDGTKWTKKGDWVEPLKDEVRPLIESNAKDYVEKAGNWPKRTESCEKSS